MCIGGVRQTVANSISATSTHNYHQTSVRFGVLSASYELSSLDIFFYPYPTSIWLGLVVVFAMSIVLLLIMDRLLQLREQSSILLNLELIFVGMPMLQLSSSIAKSVYCIMLMFYTLLIRTVYQGMLYHLIRTHQLNRLPQSIEELVAHNYTVVLSASIHDALSEISTVQQMRYHLVDVNGDLMQPLHYLAARPRDKWQVAATVQDIFLMYNRLSAYTAEAQSQQREANHFEIIAQDVIDLQLTMYLRKHSFLIDAFNEEIMWMRSVGLLAIWARWELDESQIRATQLSFRLFGIQELYVIFILILIGLLLSTLIFCLELLSVRSVRLQRWFLSK